MCIPFIVQGHDTDFVTENLTYDVFGNVTQRTTIIPGGAQRVESTLYDASGRFVRQVTSPDGLVNKFDYDYSKRVVSESIDELNRTETYVHDSWIWLTNWTDYLGNTRSRSYARGLKADPDNSLFQHEYGHYLQSQASGVFYLPRYGVPSLFSTTDNHNLHPVEQDANSRAFQYFNQNIEGYSGWNFDRRGANPIVGYNQTLPFQDPANQMALQNNRLRLSWHNFVFGPSVIFGGPINAWILNTR